MDWTMDNINIEDGYESNAPHCDHIHTRPSICMPCITQNINTPVALNTADNGGEDFTDFGFGIDEFGTDNCATHHI